MMNQQDVVGLLKKAAENNIEIWLDGGWGVDALVGRQTRPHDDLDVFVQRSDSGQFIELLTKDGFIETEVAFTTEGHKAFFHTDGRAVDLHLFEFSKEGALLFEGNAYPSEVLEGKGTIGRIAAQCLTAEAQLLYHQGYEHGSNDAHDVLLICDTFGLPVPDEYKQDSK